MTIRFACAAILIAATGSILGNPDASASRTVTLQLRSATSGVPAAGTIRFRAAASTVEVREAAVASGGVVSASLPRGSRWIVEPAIPGWWMPPEILAVGHEETPLVLERRVWPTTVMTGTFAVAAASRPLPSRFTIQIDDPPATPKPSGLPKGTRIDCRNPEEGRWTCDVPVGVLDLSIRAGGFVPEYRWALRLVPRVVTDVGRIVLRPGASVVAWGAVEGEGARLANARASLRRLVAAQGGSMRERLQRPVASGVLRPDGFMQLTGVEPGTYELRIEQAGYAPARLFPVEVFAGAETAIRRPLVMRPPLDLAVTVVPALDPAGQPWRVTFARRPDFGSTVEDETRFIGQVDETGRVEARAQIPGLFDVTVSDILGNRYGHESLAFTSIADAQHTIRLPLVEVVGQVTYRDKPIAAAIRFGGIYGATRVATRSDAEGTFQTVLPNAGSWQTEVDAGEIRTVVRIEVPESKDAAHVRIVIPYTGVDGVVLSESGDPVAGADVSLAGENNIMAAVTRADGRFTFQGVPEGRARLSAQLNVGSRKRFTNDVTFDVSNGSYFGPYELRLGAQRQLEGSVVSLRGTVPGAAIQIRGVAATAFAGTVTSDMNGAFRIDLPEDVERVVAVVSPPGHSLRAFSVPVDGRKALLNVQDAGGTLTVRVEVPTAAKPTTVAIYQDDLEIAMGALFQWSRNQGGAFFDPAGSYTIPNVSAGVYRACVVPLKAGQTQGGCRTGTLAPGGTLELDLR